MRVEILGAGNAGYSLGTVARDAGNIVKIRPARRELPTRPCRAELLIIAVRDSQIANMVQRLLQSSYLSPNLVCVHIAGALGAEVLADLRSRVRGVAQMHPLVSFACRRFVPSVKGATAIVNGDECANAVARRFVRSLGMTPRTLVTMDPRRYHAAAAVVSNGTAALAAQGAFILESAGFPKETLPAMLGPLLRSVAENIDELGFPNCLTGPVRRGDLGTVMGHLKAMSETSPESLMSYAVSALMQIRQAVAIGEAPPEILKVLAAKLNEEIFQLVSSPESAPFKFRQ